MIAFKRSYAGGRQPKAGKLRIPTEAGQVFRFEAGQRSDMKSATIPN
jgi:hypothetical protein